MRKSWTKTECRQLRNGDVRTLRRWFYAYADSLYTWLVRHAGLSVSDAQEKIAHLFQSVYSGIEQYNPSVCSMYGWLLEQAAASFLPSVSLEGLRAIPKAQEVLFSLSRLGNSDFPQEHLENPLTVHLIQAVLSEMDETHRRILLSRYYRIDGEEPLLVTPALTAEDSEKDLSEARYYFRRFLSAWVRKLQPSLTEMSGELRLDVFEKNLEKIFRTISPFLTLPSETRKMIEDRLLEEADRRRLGHRSERVSSQLHRFWPVAAVLMLGLAGVVYYFVRSAPEPMESEVILPKTVVSGRGSAPMKEVKKETADDLREILNQVFAAGSAGDVPELLRILQSGPYPAQVAASVFLGRFGDATAIGPLEKASRRWSSSPTEDDPFLLAIEQIEQRLGGVVSAPEPTIEIVVLEPNQPAADPQESEPHASTASKEPQTLPNEGESLLEDESNDSDTEAPPGEEADENQMEDVQYEGLEEPTGF
ncbi:MAG: hypothetical protein WHS88_01235 [Anaerohalosphaeraceae bacterium]